jgi:hypothetical protein
MNYNKEEVEKHLNIIGGYLDFIKSLINKYNNEKPKIKKKMILKDLIYYSDGLLNRLCSAFDFIIKNFRNTDNFFLLEYRVLKLCSQKTINKISKLSIERITDISNIKNILEINLKVINHKATHIEKLYLNSIFKNPML